MTASPEIFPWWQQPAYLRGLELLNAGHFFAAHESLELTWRELTGSERLFVQGLIQLAVALHHHRAGNREGARSLLDRARRNLAPHPDRFGEIDVAALRLAMDRWLEFFHAGGPPPAPLAIVGCPAARQC